MGIQFMCFQFLTEELKNTQRTGQRAADDLFWYAFIALWPQSE